MRESDKEIKFKERSVEKENLLPEQEEIISFSRKSFSLILLVPIIVMNIVFAIIVLFLNGLRAMISTLIGGAIILLCFVFVAYLNRVSKDKWRFKRFSFPSNLDSSQGKKHHSKLVVNIPERCPICGSKEIRGSIKIFNKEISQKDYITISIQRVNKFINLNICKEHIYLTEINFKKEYIILFSSALLGFFLIFYFSPLLGAIIIIIGVLYSLFSDDKKTEKIRIIDKYVNFDYFPEYSIISIKRSDWAEEFRKLNQCEEYKQGITYYGNQ